MRVSSLYRVCAVILYFVSVLLGKSSALESAELSISNDRLQVTLSVPMGILAVKDRQSGIRKRPFGNYASRKSSGLNSSPSTGPLSMPNQFCSAVA